MISKEEAMRLYKRIYPDFPGYIVAQTKASYIFETEFPDGTFYFRVSDSIISRSYNTLEDALRE